MSHAATTPAAGSGPSGTLVPQDIQTAHNTKSIRNGGYSLALVEFGTATYTDLQTYATTYNLFNIATINMINVDGTPLDTGVTAEVILDLELVQAMANPSTITLYNEAYFTEAGALDVYSKIASDNSVGYISVSYLFTPETTSEEASFQKMSTEGIAAFVASGDGGAYSNPNYTTPTVGNPTSDPYVTSVGGTVLTLDSNQNYVSETAWGRRPPDLE